MNMFIIFLKITFLQVGAARALKINYKVFTDLCFKISDKKCS